ASFVVPSAAPPAPSPLSLHDALPIYQGSLVKHASSGDVLYERTVPPDAAQAVYDHCRQHGLHLQAYVDDRLIVPEDNAKVRAYRSEEHTSELQSRENLVCRLLLEKKK